MGLLIPGCCVGALYLLCGFRFCLFSLGCIIFGCDLLRYFGVAYESFGVLLFATFVFCCLMHRCLL